MGLANFCTDHVPTRAEGVKNPGNLADVIYGWYLSLILTLSLTCTTRWRDGRHVIEGTAG